MTYPKRLIEVDLPIARISAHSRREKSIRHGHISTLHIWWARRPLAACRAVVCATLWPDPADELCPASFNEAAVRLLREFARRVYPLKINQEGDDLKSTASQEGLKRWEGWSADDHAEPTGEELRGALLDFIADFANWDNSTEPAYLETSRAITETAHVALGGEPGTRPLVVDPFAGGGSIPLEALRVGADAFASDLNPVAVLLNKLLLEYVPKFGTKLAEAVSHYGDLIKQKAHRQLVELYPVDSGGATPIAYIWARTIRCEGPACGAELPLVRSFLLGKRGKESVGLKLDVSVETKTIDYKILTDSPPEAFTKGTLARGSATCPVCGYTTPGGRVRAQAAGGNGGANSARLLAVYCDSPQGRFYREPNADDLAATKKATSIVDNLRGSVLFENTSVIPDEPLPYLRSIFNVNLIGIVRWEQMFSARQLASLLALANGVRECYSELKNKDPEFATAVATVLAFAVDRQADYASSICTWVQSGEFIGHTFAQGQSLPIKWDFAEVVPFSTGSGNWDGAIGWIRRVLENLSGVFSTSGHIEKASAAKHPLPDDSAQVIFTDPPYYDAVPYADLSDFFYVWLKRTLGEVHPALFASRTTPKDGEIVQLAERNPAYAFKTREYFEQLMSKALSECRRIAAPTGLAVVVFAHKETSAWETMLSAVIDAGWTAVASWPIDTERAGRLRAMGSAALASSVHLVCRPRETANSTSQESVGEWRDILDELPRRIHEWMPRLAAEGVVGADAIFACLGPALEIFSRFSRVENAKGNVVPLKEYLEYVWAAVSTEALSMIFRDADAAGLEPDARLTAMWLWTIGGGKDVAPKPGSADGAEDDDADDEEEPAPKKAAKSGGFTLEFDAARKIAQGLGVHLEKSESIVEVSGETARLLPVSERTRRLFGVDGGGGSTGGRKKKIVQKTFFEDLNDAEAAEEGWGELKGPPPGTTVLDRLHQTMILFAAGRGELMKRFLIDDGVGKDARFWNLAQSLSALYPTGTDERRWVEGVLARKKGLGL